TWRAPYSARQRPSSSPLATLDGGAARGYVAVPQVERAVAVHLCPRAASPFQGVAYHAAGQAATALHAMATLQVYQAQALKHLHEGGPDQGAMQELRAATNFALRATKVMSTVVVQERHLWLTLAQMADVDKACFLDTPISQGGLFGNTKQTEAIKHTLPRRDSATTSPGPQPPPARRRGRPPAGPKKTAPSTSSWPDRPLTPAGDLRSVPDAGNPEVDPDNTYVPPPGGGPGAAVYSDAAIGLRVDGTHIFTERVNLLTSGVPAPSSLLERRLASSDPDSELYIASAGTREEDFSPGCFTFWDQLPHRGHIGQRSLDSPRDQAGDLASASQPLAVVDSDSTRPPRYRGVLSTTVHSDTHAAVLHAEVAVLLAKDAIEPVPPAEMKSEFYSPYFIVPKKSGGLRPILDLRALNRSLLRLPFKMLMTKRMLTCIRRQDWFAAIDLKDAHFHVSILPRHRPFLR
ncbi:hypothetical protein M9458_010719, partial [Cirrhinus mrigala]